MKTKYDVYISYKISGNGSGELDQESKENVFPVVLAIGEMIEKLGLNPFIPHKFDEKYPAKNLIAEIYPRDIAILRQCRCMVVFHNNDASDGRGIEAQFCVQQNIPIILIAKDLTKVSPMLAGIPAIRREIIFTSTTEILPVVQEAVQSLIRPPLATAIIAL
ncbi:hypothetical protein COU00_03825 [Candidatus Falkowbacteria bacterium CG10_big_fil_rev_8_21_14_0_10_43_11]|uniref:Nucleoside 2-deoxyribosyltransferase n=1 Tax=Candidatus Falkowbacteria bacterium CG10_big_fil_rev_8_21_14_0_10_43_11 TaxID=1974568 RepID=A0A2M6WL81_9BACT|nr:MAG: hypothetical protein COU00_03825 [Candidatus Falkowbacteria bacterium CG10_big_fil_rev_8_21_14_0_10_43_11]